MGIRLLTEIDLAAVNNLADNSYPAELYERPLVIADRLACYPDGCFGYFSSDGLNGYLLSLPWRAGHIVPLDSRVILPPDPDCLYIHDLAVDSSSRRRGIGAALCAAAEKECRRAGLLRLALVGVNDSGGFWTKLGFQESRCAASLAAYGGPACYMVKSL